MTTKLSTTTEANIRHQQLLAQVMRPASHSLLEKIKLKKGSRALCLNCGEGDIVFYLSRLVGNNGTVTGSDPNRENIQTAQQLTQILNIRNATFCTTQQYGPGNGQTFELIHCHLSLHRFFDLVTFIEEIRGQLMPGGMALFEMVDFSGFNSTPKNFAFELFLELYATVIRSHWGNIAFSAKLVQSLAGPNLQHLQHQYVAPTFLRGGAKNLPSLTLECIWEEVLSQKLTSEDELQVLLYELKDFERKTYSLISLPGIHQIWVHKL